MIAWKAGILLERTRTSILAPNELACEAAEAALKKGKLVVLTVDGKPWSYLKASAEGVKETKIK